MLLVWSANPNERMNTVTYQCFCHVITCGYKSTMQIQCVDTRHYIRHKSTLNVHYLSIETRNYYDHNRT